MRNIFFKYHLAFIMLFLVGLFSCKTETNGQEVDNTKPMYGEVAKSGEYKKLDEDFIKESLEKFKTRDSAVFVYVDQAWRYFYHNDLKTAMKRFNQAWLLNPAYADSYFGFAALLDLQKDELQADRFYKLGEERDKLKERAAICYQRIADCKEQLEDISGAIDAYNRIGAINPKAGFAFKKIGYLAMQQSNFDEALLAYGKAISLDPLDAVTYNNRAYLYKMKKDYTNAMADYSKAIKLDPKYISAYVNRGIAEIETMDYKAAQADFEICVGLDSKTGELRRFLGLAKLYLKDKTGACKDLKLAKELGDAGADELIQQNCK